MTSTGDDAPHSYCHSTTPGKMRKRKPFPGRIFNLAYPVSCHGETGTVGMWLEPCVVYSCLRFRHARSPLRALLFDYTLRGFTSHNSTSLLRYSRTRSNTRLVQTTRSAATTCHHQYVLSPLRQYASNAVPSHNVTIRIQRIRPITTTA